LPTQQKIDTVAELTDKLQRSQCTLVADYRGLTVAEISDLRRRLRETGAELTVAKNTLVLLAARAVDNAALEPLLAGPTALAFMYDDVPKVVKAINDFNRGPKKLTVRGGMLGTTVLKEDVLTRIASLPQRPDVLAQIVGGVVSPLSSVVGLLGAPVNDVAGIVDAVVMNVLYAVQGRIDQMQSADSPA
jgi:large subunit ribosomal protein L10